MKGIKNEIYSIIIILLTNILIIAMSILIMFLINHSSKVDYLFLKFLSYILICIVTFQINKRYKTLLVNILANIIYLPITIFALFTLIALPVLSVQMSIFLYLFFSFLAPLIAYRVDEYFQLTVLNFETWVYIIITLGIMIAFLFHKYLKFLVDKIVSIMHQKSERIQKLKLIELNDFVISINNIKFTIFFLYMIYLITTNLMALQNKSFYENPNIDKAVLQSFVTFVAIDRILTIIKQTEFKPSKLLEILKSSFKEGLEK
jgi:hypothetical protein